MIQDGRTVLDLADATSNWNDFSAGTGISLETDTIIEGTGSIAETNDSTSTYQGVLWDNGSAADFSGNHFYFWFNHAAAGLVQDFVVRFSTDGSNWLQRRFATPIVGRYFRQYTGGWVPLVFSVDKIFEQFGRKGGNAPQGGTFRYAGCGAILISGSMPKKQDNLFLDAAYRLPANTPGIRIEGTNGGSPWTWQDLLDWSQGLANGLVSSVGGVIYVNAPIQIGDAGDSESPSLYTNFLDDSGRIVSFSDDLVEDDFFGITIRGNSDNGTDFQLGQVVGSGDSRRGAVGGTIRSGNRPWYFDAETDIANVDTVNLYGVTFIGASGVQLSSNSKTRAINLTARDCGQVEINDAEVLNYTQVAPRGRGLELLSTSDIKNSIFIAGAKKQKVETFGTSTVSANAAPGNPYTFSHTVASGSEDVALLVLVGGEHAASSPEVYSVTYNSEEMEDIGAVHCDTTATNGPSARAFLLRNPTQGSSQTVSITSAGTWQNIVAKAINIRGCPPASKIKVRGNSTARTNTTTVNTSIEAVTEDSYSVDMLILNASAPGGGATADGDNTETDDAAIGTESAYMISEITGGLAGTRQHDWSWSGSVEFCQIVLLFEDQVEEHHVHMPETASPDFEIPFDNLQFFGFDTAASPDTPGYDDKWHGEASGGTDVVIQASNGANPQASLFEVPGSEVVSVQNAVGITVTCVDSSGNPIQGVRVRIETDPGGSQIDQGETNSSGLFTSTYNYEGDQDVLVKARLKGYLPNRTLDTIDGTGLGVTFVMQTDTIVNLP